MRSQKACWRPMGGPHRTYALRPSSARRPQYCTYQDGFAAVLLLPINQPRGTTVEAIGGLNVNRVLRSSPGQTGILLFNSSKMPQGQIEVRKGRPRDRLFMLTGDFESPPDALHVFGSESQLLV